MAKRIPNEIKKRLRKEYELGRSLIDLAIKYQINYGTLRHIASKENWIKNRIAEISYLKEVDNLTNKLALEKQTIKSKYQELTKCIFEELEDIDTHSDEEAKKKAEIVDLKIKSLKESYSLDKELYNILNTSDEIELDIKRVQLEEMKEKLNYFKREEELNIKLKEIEFELKKKEAEEYLK